MEQPTMLSRRQEMRESADVFGITFAVCVGISGLVFATFVPAGKSGSPLALVAFIVGIVVTTVAMRLLFGPKPPSERSEKKSLSEMWDSLDDAKDHQNTAVDHYTGPRMMVEFIMLVLFIVLVCAAGAFADGLSTHMAIVGSGLVAIAWLALVGLLTYVLFELMLESDLLENTLWENAEKSYNRAAEKEQP